MFLSAVRGVCDHADAEAQPAGDPNLRQPPAVRARGGVGSII